MRKLKATWTAELEKDFAAWHGEGYDSETVIPTPFENYEDGEHKYKIGQPLVVSIRTETCDIDSVGVISGKFKYSKTLRPRYLIEVSNDNIQRVARDEDDVEDGIKRYQEILNAPSN
jgi:hypothetical protein